MCQRRCKAAIFTTSPKDHTLTVSVYNIYTMFYASALGPQCDTDPIFKENELLREENKILKEQMDRLQWGVNKNQG